MEKPKVVFFDAVGTLFGVRGSVGEIYHHLAREFGVDVPADKLQQAFVDNFITSEPLQFPGVNPLDIPENEFQWWKAIAYDTFAQVGVIEQFSDFDEFFNQLYGHFATPEPWYVYDDVLPLLEKWREQGMEMGIISNFDSRIHAVLQGLELRDLFSSVTISSTVGAAKPDGQIFKAALSKYGCEPTQALHIGDSLTEDYHGAKAAGLQALFLQRDNPVLGN